MLKENRFHSPVAFLSAMQVQSQTIFLRNNEVEMEEDLWPMIFPFFGFYQHYQPPHQTRPIFRVFIWPVAMDGLSVLFFGSSREAVRDERWGHKNNWQR